MGNTIGKLRAAIAELMSSEPAANSQPSAAPAANEADKDQFKRTERPAWASITLAIPEYHGDPKPTRPEPAQPSNPGQVVTMAIPENGNDPGQVHTMAIPEHPGDPIPGDPGQVHTMAYPESPGDPALVPTPSPSNPGQVHTMAYPENPGDPALVPTPDPKS